MCAAGQSGPPPCPNGCHRPTEASGGPAAAAGAVGRRHRMGPLPKNSPVQPGGPDPHKQQAISRGRPAQACPAPKGSKGRCGCQSASHDARLLCCCCRASPATHIWRTAHSALELGAGRRETPQPRRRALQMTTFVDEAAWASSDWKWDAYNLTAAPADGGAGGKSPQGRGGSVEPAGGKQGCQVRAAQDTWFGRGLVAARGCGTLARRAAQGCGSTRGAGGRLGGACRMPPPLLG
jgi:hypothetical protein